jgi:alpha-tubulin suppressor-like RCC1 family protein
VFALATPKSSIDQGFPPVPPLVSVVPAAIQGKVMRMVCRAQHILAILKDGTSVAWGDPADGKTKLPVAAEAKGATLSMSAGDHFSLWLLKNGTALKAGNLPGVKTAIVPLSEPAKAIAAGRSHGAAILASSGAVVAFGDSVLGQSFNTEDVNANKPVSLIAAADECNIALTVKGLVTRGGDSEFDVCSAKPPFPKDFTP